MKSLETEAFRTKYNERKDGRDWKLSFAQKDLINNKKITIRIGYKPFDKRFTIYTGTTKGFMAYPRQEISEQFIDRRNNGLVLMRKLVNTKLLNLFLLLIVPLI